MTKKYSKKKAQKKKSEPPHRTPDYFKNKTNVGKPAQMSRFGKGVQRGQAPQTKFNPAQFKVQHRG